MYIYRLFIGALCSLFVVAAWAQTPSPLTKDWERIDQALQKQHLDDAWADLQALAPRIAEPEDRIRYIAYQYALIGTRYEDLAATDSARYTFLQAAFAERPKQPVKAILHFYEGQFYQEVMMQQLWANRDNYPVQDSTLDYRRQSTETLFERSMAAYQAAVADTSGMLQPYGEWSPLVTAGASEASPAMPYLYDLVAARALRFMSDLRYQVWSFVEPPVDWTAALSTPTDFMAHDWGQGLDPNHAVLRLWQRLMRLHHERDNRAALLHYDLARMQWAFDQQRTLVDTYIDRLTTLEAFHKGDSLQADILLALGDAHAHLGNQYNAYDPAQRHKWARKTAFNTYEKAIREYPDTYGGKMAMTKQAALMQKTLSFSTEKVLYPGERSLVTISYRNLSTLYAKLVPQTQAERSALSDSTNAAAVAWLNARNPLRTWTIDLPDDGDHHAHRTEWLLDGLPAGQYILLLSDNEYFYDDYQAVAYQEINVSRLAYYSHSQPNERPTYFVVDRQTGQPLQGVEATFFKVRYDYSTRPYRRIVTERDRQTSGSDGLVYTEKPADVLRLTYQGDTLALDDDLRDYVNGLDTTRTYRRIALFTDRGLYRPGQEIHFKGIAMMRDHRDQPTILVGDSVTLNLFNNSGQIIDTRHLVTNSFGTFSGTFTAPSTLLGYHAIVAGDTYYGGDEVAFRVEEYKRPTFKADFEALTSRYELGDSITLTGTAMAYAGYPLAGVQVSYYVERQTQYPQWRWWWGEYPSRESVTLVRAETTTDADGMFHIPFTAIPDSASLSANGSPQFQYTVVATITDLTGESHTVEHTVSIGVNGLNLTISHPQQLNLQSPTAFEVKAHNASGQPQSVRGTVQVLRLAQPDRVFKARYWQRPDTMMYAQADFYTGVQGYPYAEEDQVHRWAVRDTVATLRFDTDSAKALDVAALGLSTGHYRIIATTTDDRGRIVTYENIFVAFDPSAPEVPVSSAFWWHMPDRTYAPGEAMVVYFGGAGYRNYTMIEVRDGKRQVIHREWVLSRNLHQWRYPITEAHRGNIRIKAITVADGRVFEHSELVRVPWDKELDITLETFRDKLTPGQQETWTLRIDGAADEGVTAELLASMYDASLDAIYRTDWRFRPFPTYNSNVYTAYRDNFTSLDSRLSANDWQPSFVAPVQVLPALDLDYKGLQSLARLQMVGYRPSVKYKRAMLDGDLRVEEVVADSAVVEEDEEQPAPAPTEEDVPTALGDIMPRTRLDETVFFKPHLRTDSTGRIALTFTMNEALTTWKLRLLAHTQALDYGYQEATTITQKSLMVQPFAPRLLRQRDTLVFTSKVTSLIDTAVSGAAQLQLFDAVTGAEVTARFGVAEVQQSFDLSPKGQIALNWTVFVPAEWPNPIRYRVVARAGRHTDGEESVLPVLTDRILLTEALPLRVRGRRKASYTFGALDKATQSSSSSTHSLTLQFTQNPAWEALKAMPYLMEYPYACSEQVFNRLYAHSLSANVVRKAPRVTAIMEAWRTTDSTALRSQLQQNEALKTALLAETPWVLDAQSETEQMQQLAALLDLVELQKHQDKALATLWDRQLEDGAFPWFSGGTPSRYMTQYIAEGFAHLSHLGVKFSDSRAKAMAELAVRRSDQWMVEDYATLKAQVKSGATRWEDDHLDATLIQYLYMRSFYKGLAMDEDTRTAFNYYLSQVKTHWMTRSSIYELGMMALVCNRHLAYEPAKDIVKALRQRAQRSDEQGMYWKGTSGYYWYELPIETQALMIEVFSEVARDEAAIGDLKFWLLRQKRTQQWSTTKGTAAAIYALLVTGSDWLATHKPIEIQLGGKSLALNEVGMEAGTGSFAMTWPADTLQGSAWSLSDFKRIELKNPNRTPAWGAMYWQYFEDYDAVKATVGTPLEVSQTLYKRVHTTSDGDILLPLQADAPIRVGDKVTLRVTLRASTMMEYVHLKVMHGTGLAALEALSAYRYRNGLGFYESPRDGATDFFLDYLPKGTYTFDVDLVATHSGQFSMGVTTAQSMYAPEYTAHTQGTRVTIGEE